MYTLGDIPKKGATVFPDKVATVFEDVRLTYRQLNSRVNRFANALINLGCKKGDRIAILAENTHKYLEVYFASGKIGVSVTPINFRLSDKEILHIINDCEAVALIVGDGYAERVIKMSPNFQNILYRVSLEQHLEGFLSYEELIDNSQEQEPGVEVDENELAILMYTGGTTGLPKGVMLSHRNLLTAMYGLIIDHSFTKHDIECFTLPLFHISLWPAVCPLMVGGTVVILRRPDLHEILRLIDKERCTHTNLVPTLLVWILSMPDLDKYDLSSLRSINYAGSPMAPDVLKRCIAKFGNIFTQGYGLTEAAPIVSLLSKEDHAVEGPKAKLLKSVGKEGPVVEVRIIDEKDNPVQPDQLGEIAVRGKNVMVGYWKNPELTASALRGGWLHTGDLGYMDNDGYIFLIDRKADMIVSGGENVYPKEVEDVIYAHEGVQECAVVSRPDTKWGEIVLAAVVLKTDWKVSESDLISHCKTMLAGYKCPKRVEFFKELPKTAVGKILRKDIKKRYWASKNNLIG
jgi:long-chain acyl-CoA synthetase